MKQCPYCGRDYPDEAERCLTDGSVLLDIRPVSVVEQKLDAPLTPGAEQVMAVEPNKAMDAVEFKWSALEGWKCLGMLLVFSAVLGMVIGIINGFAPQTRGWNRSSSGYAGASLLHYVLFALVAMYFARTETKSSFLRGFGLDRKPTERAWFGIAAALAIRAFGHLMISHHWSRGVTANDLAAFRRTITADRYLFLTPLVCFAPLFEELVYRGFLYRAFRNTYPIWASMGLIVAWTVNSHWSQYSVSWAAAIAITLLTIVQCYLREKSDSLWDSILCHFVFNVSLLFLPGGIH